MQNFANDELDSFTVSIDAKANDQTIRDEKIVNSDDSSFREFWTFEWEKGEWLLREVAQTEACKRFVAAEIFWEQRGESKRFREAA